jgi:hypothetical protein
MGQIKKELEGRAPFEGNLRPSLGFTQEFWVALTQDEKHPAPKTVWNYRIGGDQVFVRGWKNDPFS